MRVIEIVAAELADQLAKGGTKFEMDPDHVIWPDGTITKKPTQTKSKKTKKVPPAVSKHGLYGVIVAQYGSKNKNFPKAQQAISIEPSQSATSQASGTEMVTTQEKQKQTRRCNYTLTCIDQVYC